MVSTTAYCTPTCTSRRVSRVGFVGGRPSVNSPAGRNSKNSPMVRHQPQEVVPRVFGGDEPLAGRVHFTELDGLPDLGPEHLAVRVELGAAVDHQPEHRPHVGHGPSCRWTAFTWSKRIFTQLGTPLTAVIGCAGRPLGQQRQLLLPVAQQCEVERRE